MVFTITFNIYFHMKDEIKLNFRDLANIESVCAVLGLVFPASATEFQKAALTLAHLMASLRDFVLKGHDIPLDLVELADRLSIIMVDNEYKQR